MNLHTEGGDVLLLKLSSQMTLDERGLLKVSLDEFGSALSARMRALTRSAVVKGSVVSLTLPVPPSPTKTSLKVGGA